MGARFDLPDTVPLFPLPGVLLLPRARIPLQLFEPRYLQMFEDVLKTPARLIGMIQPGPGDGLAPIGTAGRIVAFSELDDGRCMIQLRAISRFRLLRAEDGFSPYRRGVVAWGDFARDRDGAETAAAFDRGPFLDRLRRFMATRDLATDMEAVQAADDEMLVNALSMLLPFAPEEKQALLEAPTLDDRVALLDGLIEYALHSTGAEERMQ